jgi:hypothetical protein
VRACLRLATCGLRATAAAGGPQAHRPTGPLPHLQRSIGRGARRPCAALSDPPSPESIPPGLVHPVAVPGIDQTTAARPGVTAPDAVSSTHITHQFLGKSDRATEFGRRRVIAKPLPKQPSSRPAPSPSWQEVARSQRRGPAESAESGFFASEGQVGSSRPAQCLQQERGRGTGTGRAVVPGRYQTFVRAVRRLADRFT